MHTYVKRNNMYKKRLKGYGRKINNYYFRMVLFLKVAYGSFILNVFITNTFILYRYTCKFVGIIFNRLSSKDRLVSN